MPDNLHFGRHGMNRLAALVILAVSPIAPAHAGGGIGYSATDASGTVERVVELRGLRDGLVGAMVSYTRTDGSRSFVEYAVRCDGLAYAYLGINSEDDASRTPNLLTVRNASDRLLANTLRPVELINLEGGPGDAPLRNLATAVCS